MRDNQLRLWVGGIAVCVQLLLASVGYAQVAQAPRVEVARPAVGAPQQKGASVALAQAQISPGANHASDGAASQQQQQSQRGAAGLAGGGSLLRSTLAQQPTQTQAKLSNVSLFAVPEQQPKTIKKHDLITVIIREQAEISSDAKTEATRDSSIDARITEFLKISAKDKSIKGRTLTDPPSIAASANREFTADGKADRSDSFTTRMTVEVIDVKPNGTLVFQGKRNIRHNEETQHYLLTGTCRAEDVTPDNTILSTQVADFDLRRDDKGAVRDATKRGGAQKFLDWLNPF